MSVNRPVTIEGLPAGAQCSVWETSVRGGSADHTADNPVEMTIEPGIGEAAVQTAEITNTFQFGELTLKKDLEGDAADYATDRTFKVDVSCTLPDAAGAAGDRVWQKTYEVKTGEPVTVKPLPVNSRCWAEEVDTGGASKAVVDHGSPDNPAVVTAAGSEGGGAVITVTNTFPAAKLTVTKHVVNGGSGPYEFGLACTTDQGDVALAADDSAFSLKDGEERDISVPEGAECTVTELNVPDGDTVTVTASDGGTDGTVVVAGDASVDVTNTFEKKPDDGDGDHPDDGDGDHPGKGDGDHPGKGDGDHPGKDDGDHPGKGKGHLADTGVWTWTVLGILTAVLALVGGVAVRKASSRRTS